MISGVHVDFDAFVERTERSLLCISVTLSKEDISEDEVDTCAIRCQRILDDLDAVLEQPEFEELLLTAEEDLITLSSSVSYLLDAILGLINEYNDSCSFRLVNTRPAHRPKLHIKQNQLTFLIQ